MGGAKKKPKVKKRIPLPLKPPKIEPNPKAYKRREKHPKEWEQGVSREDGQARERD